MFPVFFGPSSCTIGLQNDQIEAISFSPGEEKGQIGLFFAPGFSERQWPHGSAEIPLSYQGRSVRFLFKFSPYFFHVMPSIPDFAPCLRL
jgi:hypothetical protein